MSYPNDFQVGGGWIQSGYMRYPANDKDIASLTQSEKLHMMNDINAFRDHFHTNPMIFKLVAY